MPELLIIVLVTSIAGCEWAPQSGCKEVAVSADPCEIVLTCPAGLPSDVEVASLAAGGRRHWCLAKDGTHGDTRVTCETVVPLHYDDFESGDLRRWSFSVGRR